MRPVGAPDLSEYVTVKLPYSQAEQCIHKCLHAILHTKTQTDGELYAQGIGAAN